MKDNGVSVYEAYSCIYMRNTHIFVSVIILHDTDVIHEHASYKHIHVQPYSCTANPINMYMNMHIHVQPIPLGMKHDTDVIHEHASYHVGLAVHEYAYSCTANPTWGDIFESSKLKARTSLLPRCSEKRRSSFEL